MDYIFNEDGLEVYEINSFHGGKVWPVVVCDDAELRHAVFDCVSLVPYTLVYHYQDLVQYLIRDIVHLYKQYKNKEPFVHLPTPPNIVLQTNTLFLHDGLVVYPDGVGIFAAPSGHRFSWLPNGWGLTQKAGVLLEQPQQSTPLVWHASAGTKRGTVKHKKIKETVHAT